jgi:hypothetical protein
VTTGDETNRRDPGLLHPKKACSDAELLVMLLGVFDREVREVHDVLDRALSILAATSEFPEKTNLEAAINNACRLLDRRG